MNTDQQQNNTMTRVLDLVVRVLDSDPTTNPQLASTMAMMAVATPVLAVVLCVVVMVCRGVPMTNRCSYWRRMQNSSGMAPDQAIGEHQDENCELDSVDEPSRCDHSMDDVELEDRVAPQRHVPRTRVESVNA